MIILFIFGGGGLSTESLDSFMNAIHIIFWITFAAFILTALISAIVPNSFRPSMKAPPAAAAPAPSKADDVEMQQNPAESEPKQEDEKVAETDADQ